MATRKLNGASLRALRIANKIPQGDFALRLDISQGYLSNLEKGAKQPSPILLRRLADELGEGIEAISYVVADESEPVSV